MGPAADGGFWLFGANHHLPIDCWTSVPYSRDFTLAAFRAVLETRGPSARSLTLDCLTDLDEAQDVPAVAEALEAMSRPNDAQRSLASWMRQHLVEPFGNADDSPAKAERQRRA